jgi:hypothetical protein
MDWGMWRNDPPIVIDDDDLRIGESRSQGQNHGYHQEKPLSRRYGKSKSRRCAATNGRVPQTGIHWIPFPKQREQRNGFGESVDKLPRRFRAAKINDNRKRFWSTNLR